MKKLFVMCLMWMSFQLYPAVASSVPSSRFAVEVKRMQAMADLIIVGNLKAIPDPFGNVSKIDEIIGRNFYRIESELSLKGKMNDNPVLIIVPNVDASIGSPPYQLDEGTYLFLLKKTSLGEGYKPYDYYELVDSWKSVISLDKNNTELRSVKILEEMYGFNVLHNPKAFCNAVKGLLAGEVLQKQSLSKEAQTIYQKINSN